MKTKMGKIASSALFLGLILTVSVVPSAAWMHIPTKSTCKGKNIKNVILMISDGCGSNQILATDYFTNGKSGTQIYEKFPIRLKMSTYSYGEISKDDDKLSFYNPAKIWANFDLMMNYPTDSAAAATAISTGTKTYNAAIGVDQDLKRLRNIAEDFEALGRSTGVVTSVEFSHATPAGFVAHNVNRNNYSEIAKEMVMDSATDVIMGAGNPLYDDNGNIKTFVYDGDYEYVGGKSTWDSLVAGTLGNDADGDGDVDNWKLIQTKKEFEALQYGKTPDRIIGIPQVYTTLQQARGGDVYADAFKIAMNKNVPSLAVMSKGALNVLDNDKDGFFLMIESGAVDWACHGNQSGRLIEEQTSFNEAVKAVCKWVEKYSNWNETLLIVTGDHETGYLTGTTGVNNKITSKGKGVMPVMVWNSSSHTNQLIPFHAKGKGADLFNWFAYRIDPVQGRYIDNTDISKVIRCLIH